MTPDPAEVVAIPQSTLRATLSKVFDDDWNARKTVRDADHDGSVVFHVTYRVEVPADLAKTVLADLMAAEATAQPGR